MGSTFNVRKQAFVLWEIADEAFDGSSYLECGQSAHSWYNSELTAFSLSLFMVAIYHGILSHENNSFCFSTASETLTDFMHLLRADIVDGDDEDGLVPIL